MNKLEKLLEMFTGTKKVAPVAVGVKNAEQFGMLNTKKSFSSHADCETFECNDDGTLGTYCVYP